MIHVALREFRMEKSSVMQLKGRSKRKRKERNQVSLCVVNIFFSLNYLTLLFYNVFFKHVSCKKKTFMKWIVQILN